MKSLICTSHMLTDDYKLPNLKSHAPSPLWPDVGLFYQCKRYLHHANIRIYKPHWPTMVREYSILEKCECFALFCVGVYIFTFIINKGTVSYRLCSRGMFLQGTQLMFCINDDMHGISQAATPLRCFGFIAVFVDSFQE